jgi:pyrimidine deaminase RibD-like protein
VALYEAEDARGAYLITTLESCATLSKVQIMKSCSELIIDSGIVGVIAGCLDNSPSMTPGKSLENLSRRGIRTEYYPALRSRIIYELLDKTYVLKEEMKRISGNI